MDFRRYETILPVRIQQLKMTLVLKQAICQYAQDALYVICIYVHVKRQTLNNDQRITKYYYTNLCAIYLFSSKNAVP